MVCEGIIKDLVIGLVSGGISSWLVSIALKRYWDAKELEKQFERDKQAFARYIDKLREELLIGSKMEDYSFFLRTLDDEPIRFSFTKLDDESIVNAREIRIFLDNLKDKFEGKTILTEAERKSINSKLFKYKMDIIRFKMK